MSIAFPHIQASGTYRELGRAVGEGAREQIVAALAFYQEHFVGMAGLTFDEARLQALRYLPYAERYLPQYVEELAGMAEGSGQPFQELLVPNCAEEFTCPADVDETGAPHARRAKEAESPPASHASAHLCTAVGVVHGGRRLVGHNMDWYVVDADKNVLFDLTTPDGTRIVTLAGVPYLPILGMNSHGLAYAGNSLHSNDNRFGVPNAFVRRWALEAPTIEEAASRACMPVRARGSNHLFADREGRMWNVETSARGAVLAEHHDYTAHTNHYTEPAMTTFEGYHHEESRRRLEEAQRRLEEGLGDGEDAERLIERILRSHANEPDCICGHPDPGDEPAEQGMTVASMIMDLDAMRLRACAGPPCQNEYRDFTAAAS